jgi:hypothetical protein
MRRFRRLDAILIRVLIVYVFVKVVIELKTYHIYDSSDYKSSHLQSIDSIKFYSIIQ